MGKLWRRVLLAVVCLFPATGLSAQEARQGVKPEAKQGEVIPLQRFESPMVLELPLTLGQPGVWTSVWKGPEERKRTRKFICDGAFVSDLAFKAGKPSRQERDVDLEGKISIAAEHGQDKRVDVLAEILQGEEVLGTSKITQLKVEEDEQSTRPLAFHLRGAQLKDPPELKIRLTLEVETKQ